MDSKTRQPSMTRDQFLQWVQAREEHYEFDGFEPVAMPRSTVSHSRICRNIHCALGTRLRGSGCEVLGFGTGLATVGDTVCYPDALVTCTNSPGSALLIPGAVLVFEVFGPDSEHTDRIVKLREYHAVPSLRRYILLEHESAALTVFSRMDGTADWTADVRTEEEALDMPELGISVPVQEFYEGVDLPGSP